MTFYDELSISLGQEELRFLNYGLFSPGSEPRLREVDLANRSHIQLVDRVLEGVPLDDRDLLEVGCGRGGNCDYLARYSPARSILGVDRSAVGIDFCRRAYPTGHLHFIIGTAESLPLSADCLDVVLNIESAHCYRHFDRFLAEVGRTLKPGGDFCFADLWQASFLSIDWAQRRRYFDECGLEPIQEVDISSEVFEALQREQGLIERLKSVKHRLGFSLLDRVLDSTELVRLALAVGECRYILRRFKKPQLQ